MLLRTVQNLRKGMAGRKHIGGQVFFCSCLKGRAFTFYVISKGRAATFPIIYFLINIVQHIIVNHRFVSCNTVFTASLNFIPNLVKI